MNRRTFLAASAAATLAPSIPLRSLIADDKTRPNGAGTPHAAAHDHAVCESLYASPAEAMKSPRETLAFVPCIRVGTESSKKPDYLAVVDVDPKSGNYSRVVARLEMPHVGDELHHYGWNACSSCHGQQGADRRYLILPGITSSRIHVVDVADPAKPRLYKVLAPATVKKTGLSAPHTVHCLADGQIMLSMLGDAEGNGPGGFLLLDEKFDIAGHWAKSTEGMHYNYDFWYQPRHNVMVSSEWGSPNTVHGGFKPEEVATGKYGHRIHFWDWQDRRITQSIDLGETGLIPLEVRFHHNPDSTHGFVGAALSSSMWHWDRDSAGKWQADKVIQVDPVEVDGWPFPVPGLITDLVLSLDDRWLYFSNWLHGDLRQYDVSDPAKPKLTGRVWLGGVLGAKGGSPEGRYVGGPQMLQLSLDGRRLYVTSSLFSPWDNQFYPDIAKRGSYLKQLDCDTDKGGLVLNEKFDVDFGREPGGPARAHEIRFPGGDCTSDIWV